MGAQQCCRRDRGCLGSQDGLGEAVVDDPPVLGKHYPLIDEPGGYLVFERGNLDVIVARAVDEDGEDIFIGDFIGYIGARRSTAWGLSLGSRTTGDAEEPEDPSPR